MSESLPSEQYTAASDEEPCVEVKRAVWAFIRAYELAVRHSLPAEECTLLAKLAFEAEYTIDAKLLALMGVAQKVA